MPTARIGHLVYMIDANNLTYYKDLFTFLGWTQGYEDAGFSSVQSPGDGGPSIWFMGFAKAVSNDYDGPGLQHLGLHVSSIAEVDECIAWLTAKGIEARFETPRHRPEFSSPGNTYYQVMFVSPDNIQFEIVYIGPHTN
jgi:catechol 2,3-dioxygenase-like lactoylglutathione lyase family enzyme